MASREPTDDAQLRIRSYRAETTATARRSPLPSRMWRIENLRGARRHFVHVQINLDYFARP